ncbi:hypothetical protein C8J35_11633 [Rhizobium sp. PP-F2F-G38]|nr:hypothetical protein C8J35_11633 [Rhizobium sp. PP-F2F-G38]
MIYGNGCDVICNWSGNDLCDKLVEPAGRVSATRADWIRDAGYRGSEMTTHALGVVGCIVHPGRHESGGRWMSLMTGNSAPGWSSCD